MTSRLDAGIAFEAKAFVARAFRNGPIEDLHAVRACPACGGNAEYSHISDEEMKKIMKAAVNEAYKLLWQRDNDPAAYLNSIAYGLRYSQHWDDPEV